MDTQNVNGQRQEKKDEDDDGGKTEFERMTVVDLMDRFIKTWFNIFDKLLTPSTYKKLKLDEIDSDDNLVEVCISKMQILFVILKEILWKNEEKLFVGLGFVILSYFVFFVLASK